MDRQRRRRIAGLAALALAAAPAAADPIPVYNTGVDGGGGAAPVGTIDLHWALASAPAGSGYGANLFVFDSAFIPQWLANSGVSQWLTPDTSTTHAAGEYIYRTSFDLSAYDPATAALTFRMMTDNRVDAVRLNGASLGISYLGPFDSFSQEFAINSGFTAGVNTLDFLVINDPPDQQGAINPVGLRVEIAGGASAIPEPASAALLGVGLAAFALRRRRR